MLKVVDFADEIVRETGQTDVTIPAVGFWIRTNIGAVNNLINTCYTIDPITLEIIETIIDCNGNKITISVGENEKIIFKLLYSIFYLGRKALQFLGAAGIQTSLEVDADGASIRLVDKNQVSKTYLAAKKQQEETLKNMVSAYKINRYTPLQVAGDDTVPSTSPIGYFNQVYRTKYSE